MLPPEYFPLFPTNLRGFVANPLCLLRLRSFGYVVSRSLAVPLRRTWTQHNESSFWGMYKRYRIVKAPTQVSLGEFTSSGLHIT